MRYSVWVLLPKTYLNEDCSLNQGVFLDTAITGSVGCSDERRTEI